MRNILIDGCDRLGKSSLIEGLQQELGYFMVVHYEKPKLLKAYKMSPYRYQEASFNNMFQMLSFHGRFILDRTHLGEMVYAPMYRGYSGDYVIEMEKYHTLAGSDFADESLLVLLTTSDFSFIKDDGMSFDFSKKEEEQESFKRAFNMSTIKNKLIVDVANGKGFYREREDILAQVIDNMI